MSAEGSEEAEWDIESWNELKTLADTTPAAGVWLQGMRSATELWLNNLREWWLTHSKHFQLDKTTYYRNVDLTQGHLHLWFKDLVPDVSPDHSSPNTVLC